MRRANPIWPAVLACSLAIQPSYLCVDQAPKPTPKRAPVGAAKAHKPAKTPEQSPAATPLPEPEAALRQAVDWIRARAQLTVEYNYIMTARVRLLLFWVGKDDVGGGYIRRGNWAEDPQARVFELLMGSDPARAPRAINRWGAATEVVRQSAEANPTVVASAFFGFMKTSKGHSATEMEKELAQERQGQTYLFQAIISLTNLESNVSKTLPFATHRDYNLHELKQAQSIVLERLAGESGRLRSVDPKFLEACGSARGFLASVAELVDAALGGQRAPRSACYVFNGERRMVTLQKVTPVTEKHVHLTVREEPRKYERTYRDLLQLRFENLNQTTGKRSRFEMLVGTAGELRGVPVQISYQPNWWFQVVLNLKTPPPPRPTRSE